MEDLTPSKQFQHRNEGFRCLYCGAENPPAPKTCRNHCRHCLYSLHVDMFPGDRACSCHGLLRPIGIELKGGRPYKILFLCEKCGEKKRNKVAEDDDFEAILAVMQKY